MIGSILEEKLEESQDIRSLYGKVIMKFFVEGGETVLDTANPNGNYSLFMKQGFETPLKNAIDKGRNYECLNPGNVRTENELGIEFRKIDGLDSKSVNKLLSELKTSENLYMVVMGLAQILTYGSQRRLEKLGAEINLDDPEERNQAMIEVFSERVTEMNISYLMLSDGVSTKKSIDRQAIPEDKIRLLEKDLEEKGWKVEVFKVKNEFVLAAER